MKNSVNKVSTATAQEKRMSSSSKVVSGTVQRRKRKTLDQVRSEGYDFAVRACIEALLTDGNDRQYIADVLSLQEVEFPTTNTPDWQGLFDYADWDDWVAAEQS